MKKPNNNKNYLKRLKIKNNRIIAIDTETTSLDHTKNNIIEL